MQFDRYQQAVIEHVRNESGHLIVNARAGAGKTSVILESLKALEYKGNVLLCAFSKEIERELTARAPGWATVKTIHSLGLQAITDHFGQVTIDKNKTLKCAYKVLEGTRYAKRAGKFAWSIKSLVELCKEKLVRSEAEIRSMALGQGLVSRDMALEDLVSLAVKCIKLCAADTKTIDYSDMIYFPAKFDLQPPPYDYVFVDENQDLSPGQVDLVKKLNRGRITGIGDPRQTIYGWRSASQTMMDDLARDLPAKVLPLSVTYRCPTSVVNFIRPWVPDLEARPGAPAGSVQKVSKARLMGSHGPKPGDFVLSRYNAPLTGVALHLMKRQIPAVVTGKAYGRSLAKLVEESKAYSTIELDRYLVQTLDAENQRLRSVRGADRHDLSDQVSKLADQVEAVRTIAKDFQHAADVQNTIEAMFSEDENLWSKSNVVCSSVHASKGREADNVWLIRSTFEPDGVTEEQNIWYVAVTRTKTNLYLVED